MILRIPYGVTELSLRVKELFSSRQVISWETLQLLVLPGQRGTCECFMGSPWILTGCWPGKRTGVDVANTMPDFPVIVLPADHLDPDGGVVFRLSDRVQRLPRGRYTGILRSAPMNTHRGEKIIDIVEPPERPVPPPLYRFGEKGCGPDPEPDPCPCPPPPRCCELAVFDIDLGPVCHEHYNDKATVTFALTECEPDK